MMGEGNEEVVRHSATHFPERVKEEAYGAWANLSEHELCRLFGV